MSSSLFAVVLIITVSLLLVVEAYYIFWRPKIIDRPISPCQSCSPGTGEGNPSGCRLPENYRKCKAWKDDHPNGCCVYDANNAFTCYEGGSQCQGWSCDNSYDNSGFSCGNNTPPVGANPYNDCKMC